MWKYNKVIWYCRNIGYNISQFLLLLSQRWNILFCLDQDYLFQYHHFLTVEPIPFFNILSTFMLKKRQLFSFFFFFFKPNEDSMVLASHFTALTVTLKTTCILPLHKTQFSPILYCFSIIFSWKKKKTLLKYYLNTYILLSPDVATEQGNTFL